MEISSTQGLKNRQKIMDNKPILKLRDKTIERGRYSLMEKVLVQDAKTAVRHPNKTGECPKMSFFPGISSSLSI